MQTNTTAPGQAESGDHFVNKKEIARRLKVTVRTIENWQRAGYLPYVKIASVVLFHWPEVTAHLQAHFKVCRRGLVTPRN